MELSREDFSRSGQCNEERMFRPCRNCQEGSVSRASDSWAAEAFPCELPTKLNKNAGSD
jgi:hypothetical protein